jgi:hypothetical protein
MTQDSLHILLLTSGLCTGIVGSLATILGYAWIGCALLFIALGQMVAIYTIKD